MGLVVCGPKKPGIERELMIRVREQFLLILAICAELMAELQH